jgi:hypothetical protein
MVLRQAVTEEKMMEISTLMIGAAEKEHGQYQGWSTTLADA